MRNIAAGAILAALSLQTPVMAQEWDWSVTPYLWAAGIDGRAGLGPIDADISMDFEDIVNVLRGAGMLRLETSNGRHGVFGDLLYMRLEDKDARDTIGGKLAVQLDGTIVEGAYFYHWNDTYAVEFGARYWDFVTKLKPALIEPLENSRGWTDGLVGFRANSEIGEKWSWLFRANLGIGGSDYSAGLQLDFRRKYASGNSLNIGLRVLDFAFEDRGAVPTDLDMSFAGLTLGYTFAL
jgi:hypothetical protein